MSRSPLRDVLDRLLSPSIGVGHVGMDRVGVEPVHRHSSLWAHLVCQSGAILAMRLDLPRSAEGPSAQRADLHAKRLAIDLVRASLRLQM